MYRHTRQLPGCTTASLCARAFQCGCGSPTVEESSSICVAERPEPTAKSVTSPAAAPRCTRAPRTVADAGLVGVTVLVQRRLRGARQCWTRVGDSAVHRRRSEPRPQKHHTQRDGGASRAPKSERVSGTRGVTVPVAGGRLRKRWSESPEAELFFPPRSHVELSDVLGRWT